jgi:hypothetical protein
MGFQVLFKIILTLSISILNLVRHASIAACAIAEHWNSRTIKPNRALSRLLNPGNDSDSNDSLVASRYAQDLPTLPRKSHAPSRISSLDCMCARRWHIMSSKRCPNEDQYPRHHGYVASKGRARHGYINRVMHFVYAVLLLFPTYNQAESSFIERIWLT